MNKEDLHGYKYCCQKMEDAVLADTVQCNPYSGEHYFLDGMGIVKLGETREVISDTEVTVFITHCPFCGESLTEAI